MRMNPHPSLLLVAPLSLALSGTFPLPLRTTCLTPETDLKASIVATYNDAAQRVAKVTFTNNAKETIPAFAYSVRIYEFLPGQKTYSSAFITLSQYGSASGGTYGVSSLRCEATASKEFVLRWLRDIYNTPPGTPLRVRVKLHYTSIMRDTDMANHNPYLDVTL